MAFRVTPRSTALVTEIGVPRFAKFKPLEQLTGDNFAVSVHNKLMGQINLVRV